LLTPLAKRHRMLWVPPLWRVRYKRYSGVTAQNTSHSSKGCATTLHNTGKKESRKGKTGGGGVDPTTTWRLSYLVPKIKERLDH